MASAAIAKDEYTAPTDPYSEARVQAKIMAERCVDSTTRNQCVLFIWAILDTLTTTAIGQTCFPVEIHPSTGLPAYSKQIYVGAIRALAETSHYAPTTSAADIVVRYLAETYKCPTHFDEVAATGE